MDRGHQGARLLVRCSHAEDLPGVGFNRELDPAAAFAG
jgi:hypothetical protein